MNRRHAMQYLASIAGGAVGAGMFAGCASGGPPIVDDEHATDAGAKDGVSRFAPRSVRAQNMYVATAMAPGVDIEEFGFKHAMMLPAKSFVDADGMSVRAKMQEAVARRLMRIPDPAFHGPIILDMEGPLYVGGLKSTDPQTYELSTRRMNAAIRDLRSILPGVIVSTYDSPHVHRGREDYDVARRAIQRLDTLSFFNPSLYDNGLARRESVEVQQAEKNTRVVEFARTQARLLGVQQVLPMLHHRYRAGSGVDKENALALIGKDEYQSTQVKAARNGGAHGIILWHADLYSLRLAQGKSRTSNTKNMRLAKRRFGDVTLAQLAQIHRDVLQWASEAFLSDD